MIIYWHHLPILYDRPILSPATVIDRPSLTVSLECCIGEPKQTLSVILRQTPWRDGSRCIDADGGGR